MAVQLPIHFEFRANQMFADFYPGKNQEIVTQLRRSARNDGELLLFIWGEAGHGKSHLLQACCQDAFQQSTTAFYADLANHADVSPAILMGLEMIELVCLDNIDAIAGNAEWENACFHLFNQLRDRGHRLVVSASHPANSLHFLLPDLTTRLNWGLSLMIQPFDDDDKIAAITFKAKRMGINVAPPVARYLLTRSDRNLAALWRMLDKLDWASLAAQRKLTIPFLKQVLAQRD